MRYSVWIFYTRFCFSVQNESKAKNLHSKSLIEREAERNEKKNKFNTLSEKIVIIKFIIFFLNFQLNSPKPESKRKKLLQLESADLF